MTRVRRPSPETTLVLRALAARPREWSHGYELCTQLGIKAGTMYPILIRLAERGQIETMWEENPPKGRPARHLYRVTPKGAAVAAELAVAPARARSATSVSLRPATGAVS